MTATPPPGSDAAHDQGCTCPVLDNAHGRGIDGRWWIAADCPLHGQSARGRAAGQKGETRMTERPIMMTAESVRAILAGSKTQTRRIVKPTRTMPRIAPLQMEPWIIDGEWETDDNGLPCWAGFHPDYPGEAKWFTCPYGQPGDRLWVRETWKPWPNTARPEVRGPDDMGAIYKATWDRAGGSGWKSSIHMPRWASRITLEITDVRVERVQGMTLNDTEAEGIAPHTFARGVLSDTPPDPRWKFIELWNQINGKKHPWSSNPWVWVLTFTRVSP